jgi:hypothetical protein
MSEVRLLMLALDGRAVSARSAMTEWVIPQTCAATHSVRFADTSPIKGEDVMQP